MYNGPSSPGVRTFQGWLGLFAWRGPNQGELVRGVRIVTGRADETMKFCSIYTATIHRLLDAQTIFKPTQKRLLNGAVFPFPTMMVTFLHGQP